MKATLVLLPLLGITYMLFFINPGEDDLSQIVFIYFNSFLQSFQVGTPAGRCTSQVWRLTLGLRASIRYTSTETQGLAHSEPHRALDAEQAALVMSPPPQGSAVLALLKAS